MDGSLLGYNEDSKITQQKNIDNHKEHAIKSQDSADSATIWIIRSFNFFNYALTTSTFQNRNQEWRYLQWKKNAHKIQWEG